MVQIVRLKAIEVKKNMERIESDLPEIIKSANAKRVLIDPISILEALSL